MLRQVWNKQYEHPSQKGASVPRVAWMPPAFATSGRRVLICEDVLTEEECYKIALSSSARTRRGALFYESLGHEKHDYSFLLELSKREAVWSERVSPFNAKLRGVLCREHRAARWVSPNFVDG